LIIFIFAIAPLPKPTIVTSNNTAVETKDFSLTCNATGQIHTYRWFINGLAPGGNRIQLSQDKRILTIRSLTRRENKGPYVCEIQNPLFRNRSDPFTLNVAYGPDNATIVHTVNEYPVGANITLSCSANSNPAAQFTWLQNGQSVSNSATFSFIATLNHAGTYTCSASNSFTGLTRTATKNLIIYAPLSKPTILTSNITAVETKDFSFTCQGIGQIHVYWWLINGVAPAGGRIQLSPDKRTLTIRSLTRRENKGPYVCGIENPLFSNRSDPFTLDVAYGPDIATIVHTPDVYPTGANITLSCSATSNPPVQFTWLQNGQPVSNSATFSFIASLNHAGTYTCTASNSFTGLTRNATKNLIIYAPLSKPTIVTSNITAVETKDFSLTCQATGQIHTYRWFINGLAPSGSRIQLSPDKRTLTIRNLTRRENKGPYECEIQNPFYSNRSDPFTLDVAYGPDTATIVRTVDEYPIGANITLSCSSKSNPPVQFTWLHNGQPVSNSATFSFTASLSLAGTYTCSAANSFTGLTRTATKNVIIYAPLSTPIIVTSNNTAVETKDFSFTCQATGQIHTYRWFINGLAPAGSRIQLSPDKSTLTIRRLTRRENKGPYVCEIKNPFYSNRSDPFTLDVTYGPDTATIVRTVDEYPIGANITLSCSATSNPPVQFTWLQNGQPVSNSATFSFIASLSLAGTYTCSAANSFTGLTRTATKNVIIYAPLSKPTISTSNIAPVENKDFSMTCQATGQNHTYRWFINNRAPSGSRLQLSPDKRTFTIRSVTRRENKGPYVCEIKNPFYSNRSDPLTLNVTYGPDTPVIVPTIDAYPIGANITLLCSAVSNPPAQFNWLYNGQQVSNSATFSTITFLSQSGTYTCHASNSFTGLQATKDMNITIYGPLSRPIINSPNRIPVENIDTVSLTCNATGQVRTYQWFINNRAPTDNRIQLTRDKRTLTVGSLTREHEGSYVCEIKNPFYSNRSDPFKLNVYYGPDNAIILPKVDRYLVGTNITLSCSAKSKPPAKFIWFHKGKKWRPSAKLSLTNVSLKHAGTYICQAFNSHTGLNSIKDKNLTIYVEEKNFTDSEEKNVKINAEFTMYENLLSPSKINNTGFVIENGTAILTCNTEGYGLPDVWWYYKNKRMVLNDRMTLSNFDQTLTITPAKREDSGAYRCEIWDPFLVYRSPLFNLVVCYGPEKIKIFPNSVNGQIEVTLKENLTLGCQATSEPPAQYTWQINGSSIAVNSGNNYTIYRASWDHAGTYTCIAINDMVNATISKNIRVRVIDPNISINSTSNIIDNGTAALTHNTENEYLNIARENAGT
uniref:Ig-like domain-containing protein n=1 Tax=Monodelphis domestica TaxID=13616 RepID=M9MMJ1_MONDO